MTPLPPLTRSQRVALLGGVSLIALQGLSACTNTPVASSATYTPQVTVPVAPVPVDGYVSQEYRPADGMVTTLAVGEEDGSGPIPVEPDGGIGDGAGPIPYTDVVPTPYDPGIATTLAIGEEDGGIAPYTETGPVGGGLGQGYAPVYDSGIATTLAVGEEDGSGPIPVEPDGGIGDGAGPIPFDYSTTDPAPVDAYTTYDAGTVTTLAVGEEDGTGPIPVEPDGGIGDGAGPIPFEYGTTDPAPIDAYTTYDAGTATTLAVGEEDGSGPIPVEPDGGIGDGAGPPPFATTLALGEEDGGSYGQTTDPGIVTTLAIGEEDGSGPIPVEPDGGIGDGAGPLSFAPTYAIGEDGNGGYGEPLGSDNMTTLAIGEEG